MRTIKQIAVTAPNTVELIDRAFDDAPLKDGEIEGRTLATAVSAGTELAYFYESDERAYPCYPGYAAVFEIESVGASVSGLRIGDRVFCMGNHRERQRCASSDAVRIPNGLDPAQAACARLAGISMTTLTTAAARPPEIALVAGLGPVGNLAAQIFNMAGYRLIGVDPSAQRRAVAVECGISDVRALFPDDTDPVAGTIGLIAECSGHEKAVIDGLKIIRARGEIVLNGVPWRNRTDASAHEILNKVFHNYAVLRSGWEWELPLHPGKFQPASIFDNFRAAIDWIHSGRIKTDTLIERRAPSEAQNVYRSLSRGETKRLIQTFDWTAV